MLPLSNLNLDNPTRPLAMPTLPVPRRRRDYVEPVIELEIPQEDISVNPVKRKPDKCCTEDGSEGEGDDKGCGGHGRSGVELNDGGMAKQEKEIRSWKMD